jgi:enhancing lycopene biosynthesis protein 2
MKKKIAVLLSGCGVYDGSEIHESVFTLLAIAEQGGAYQCFAPNKQQHHVLDHRTGTEMQETRNVLTESARIARGNVLPLEDLQIENYDALAMPGGFGAAKNLSNWAFKGPESELDPQVKKMVLDCIAAKKPIVALCVSPVLIAKALENSDKKALLTLGTTKAQSPYDIAATHQALESLGAKTELKNTHEIAYDAQLNIITAPCYMMEADIVEVKNNIQQAFVKLFEILKY